MKDPNTYVKENSELNPVSLYAELKVKFEDYLLNKKTVLIFVQLHLDFQLSMVFHQECVLI